MPVDKMRTMTLPHLDDAERRRRLAVRQAVAPAARVTDPMDAVRSVVTLHATEPPTVHLSIHARTDQVTVPEVESLLYEERSLVKQLAMRRTLFAGPRDLLPVLLGGSSARTAGNVRQQVIKDVESHGVTENGTAWVEAGFAAILDRLAGGEHLSAVQLREQLPQVQGTFQVSADKRYGGTFNVAPRLITALGATGAITRGRNGGHWRTSRPQWALTSSWLGDRPEQLPAPLAWAELVRRYLARFGPATETDVVWWLGATKSIVRAAFAAIGAEQVTLDGPETGWVLPGDTELTPELGEWVALLPVLDSTLMGWKQRDWYLPCEHVRYLFDTNGNGGTTVWHNGRVIGCWVQDDGARVRLVLREEVSSATREALEVEAARVTDFLAGTVISSVYKSALMKGEPLP